MQEDSFTPHRARLRAIAYRMLGSVAEADDVVQDAYLRFRGADVDAIRSLEAWLTTCVTRLCLDRLKSARAKRETYVGPWLPEPMPTGSDDLPDESISTAFLLLLERLSPLERAAYLLHVVFEQDHRSIGETLGKSEVAVRQALHRAKQHIAAARPRFAPSKERHAELVGAFAAACQTADVAALSQLLAKDARAWTDGGGHVQAARKMLDGRDGIAKFFVGVAKKPLPPNPRFHILELNGWPWVVLSAEGVAAAAVGIETDGDFIHSVHVVLNPEKLREVTRALPTD